MYSNANSKTWAPLLDCFVNKILIANRPFPPAAMLFNGAIRVIFHNNLMSMVCWEIPQWDFLAPYPFSCLYTIIKTRSFAEYIIFIVYMNASTPCYWVTALCLRCTGNRNIYGTLCWVYFFRDRVYLAQGFYSTMPKFQTFSCASQYIPLPLLSFILNLTTATHCTIIFHSLR